MYFLSKTTANLVRGYKVSGTVVELQQARVRFLYNQQVPENPSRVEELFAIKKDYKEIYSEGPGSAVDSNRLKTCVDEKEGMPQRPPTSYVDIINFMQKGCSLTKKNR